MLEKKNSLKITLRKCPACNSTNKTEIASIKNRLVKEKYLAYSEKKYCGLMDEWLNWIYLAVNRCSECGHCWYHDMPEESMLFNMYETGRSLKEKTINRNPSQIQISEMKKLRNIVKKSSPLLLDYGSGFGRWARAAVNAGFTVTAFEPSRKRGIETAKTEFALIHDLSFLGNQKFDVINFEQVLEHVAEPYKILQKVRNYCCSTTVLRITVPNVLRCPEGSKLWEEWPFNGEYAHIMAPFEHLHGFTPKSLRKLIARAGYCKLTSLDVLRFYPLLGLRNAVGRFYPSIGQTLIIATTS